MQPVLRIVLLSVVTREISIIVHCDKRDFKVGTTNEPELTRQREAVTPSENLYCETRNERKR